jgi:hypothetical protein
MPLQHLRRWPVQLRQFPDFAGRDFFDLAKRAEAGSIQTNLAESLI